MTMTMMMMGGGVENEITESVTAKEIYVTISDTYISKLT